MPTRLLITDATPAGTATLRTSVCALAARHAGWHGVEVLSTGGPLYRLPTRLHPVGLDAELREVVRSPCDSAILAALQRIATQAGEVLIVTAPGEEGGVLAWDICSVLLAAAHGRAPEAILHLRPSGLDADSLEAAHAAARAANIREAARGRARAIVDRAAASVLSGCGNDGGSLRPDRHLAALMGILGRGNPVTGTARFRLPAAGRDFTADIPMSRQAMGADGLREMIAGRAAAHLPRCGPRGREVIPPRLPDAAEILLIASRQAGLSVQQGARALADLYDQGRLSAPWSRGTGLNARAIRILERIATRAGIPLDVAPVLRCDDADGQAIHALIDDVNLAATPAISDAASLVLAIVVREALRRVQPQILEIPDVTGLPSWARDLPWRRPVGAWRPGMSEGGPAGIHRLPEDAIMLAALRRWGVGHPHGWVNLIATATDAGLVDSQARPTTKGVALIQRLPAEMTDPSACVRVDRAIDAAAVLDTGEPWLRIAQDAMAEMPDCVRLAAGHAAMVDPEVQRAALEGRASEGERAAAGEWAA